MNAQAPRRGSELVAGSGQLGIGPGWLARLATRALAGAMRRLVARIDAGLERGVIAAVLPDGSSFRVGGHAPGHEAIVYLHDWRTMLRLATSGSVGLYQAWEAGEWESPDPVQLFALFMDNATAMGGAARAHGPWRLAARAFHTLHRNTRAGSLRNVHAHYDLGNDFYAGWLDETMSYSAAIFDEQPSGWPLDLAAGQRRKIARLAERVLPVQMGEPGDGAGCRVLELGCGWGSLAAAMAGRGCRVTAISLSEAQLDWARARHDPGIDFRKLDYRDVSGQFDAIVSAEMVEAVGQAWWPTFFECIARCLKPGGRAAIQYIAIRDEIFDAYAASADFIQTYIFPGGMLVRESSFRQLAAAHGLDWQDEARFGADYAETLQLWRERFDALIEDGRLPVGFDQRFVRLWRYYLMYCEGGFRGGGIDVVQVTLVKAGAVLA
jgi:cyclopropane-fatty-acyl-phospholipid synthase